MWKGENVGQPRKGTSDYKYILPRVISVLSPNSSSLPLDPGRFTLRLKPEGRTLKHFLVRRHLIVIVLSLLEFQIMVVRCSACGQWIPTLGGLHYCPGAGRFKRSLLKRHHL